MLSCLSTDWPKGRVKGGFKEIGITLSGRSLPEGNSDDQATHKWSYLAGVPIVYQICRTGKAKTGSRFWHTYCSCAGCKYVLYEYKLCTFPLCIVPMSWLSSDNRLRAVTKGSSFSINTVIKVCKHNVPFRSWSSVQHREKQHRRVALSNILKSPIKGSITSRKTKNVVLSPRDLLLMRFTP